MPIYFAWFTTALLSVGADARDQNLPQSGRLLYCVRSGVAVEKLAFSEESRNLRDRKCLGDCEKSFLELPDAKHLCEFLMSEFFNSHRDYHYLSQDATIPGRWQSRPWAADIRSARQNVNGGEMTRERCPANDVFSL